MKTHILTCILLLFFTNCFCQTLNSSRSVNWKLAGNRGTWVMPSKQINFLLAGGKADGVTPNDTVLSNILTTLQNDSAVIYFPNGTYFFNKPVNLIKNVILRGESGISTILLFNLGNSNNLINIVGTATSSESAILNDLKKDSAVIKVNNPSIFQAGDYIKISEVDSYLITSYAWALGSTGQICRINHIHNNDIYLESPLRRDFYTINKVKATKFNLIENVGLENLSIRRSDSTVDQTSNIHFEYAVNCRVKCVASYKCNFAHVEVRNSSNIEVTGSYFHDAFDYGNDGKAYGVIIHQSSGECLITDNIFDHLRHSMLLQAGANGNVISYNYSINPYWTGVALPSNSAGDLLLHGNYPYCNLFEGNTVQNIVIDDSHGKNGKFNTFFRNRAQLYGILMNTTTPTDSLNFIGNEITNTSGFPYGIYFLAGTGHFQYGNNVNNTITPAGTNNLPEATLYLDSIPGYYLFVSSWPPVGIPDTLNEYNIEAQDRFTNGKLTKCHDSIIQTNVTDNNPFVSLIIYPVPSNDYLSIELNNNSYHIEEIAILSLTGKRLLSIGKTQTVCIRTLSAGLYFIRIRLTDGQCIIRKFIKTDN